jgi:hypothetical protein
MMSDFYIMMSDFYVHEDENTTSTMVENFAEQLDELYDSGEANNKIVPFFITCGGGEDNPEYSLEPLYFTVINGVPLIFSTAFRLFGKSLETIDSDAGGGSLITEMLSYNNAHVYHLGVIDSLDYLDEALQQATAGNLLESNQFDAAMLNTLLIQNEIEPVRELELPNGGYVEVYALTGAEMDSLQRDKNYNNAANQTIVDYDNSNQEIYLVGIGGNASIREVAVKCGSDGFMYTVWTNNSPKFFKNAAKIVEDFPVELIENDLTDMTNALGEHIIMHLRKNKLFEQEEDNAVSETI